MRRGETSLRGRVTLAFGLLGALLSLMFAGATTFITEHYEQVLLDGILRDFAADLRSRHQAHPRQTLSLPQTHMLSGYLREADGTGELPAALTGLPPGIHKVEPVAGPSLRVGVFDLGGERLYLAIDLADIENLETGLEQILAVIVILGTLVAGWLGWLFAGRTIAPVRRLAQAVAALPDRATATQLHLLTARDELGRLAAAIDAYQARLVETDSRERQFFADASHELRTPLSVVLGTTELLLDAGQADAIQRDRLLRLERGAWTLADLLEVLLDLARNMPGAVESIDTQAWFTQILHDILGTRPMRLRIEAGSESLRLQRREAALVIRDIVRRQLRSSSTSGIDITVANSQIVMRRSEDPDGESLAEVPHASADRRASATLSGRLATCMAWVVEECQAGAGTVRISLPATAS
ncbi:MAG: HAMP domain-containing sensor histidine kinase [Dokdonella sp.]